MADRICVVCKKNTVSSHRSNTCGPGCAYELRRLNYWERINPNCEGSSNASEQHRLRRENSRLKRELAAALEVRETDARLERFMTNALERPLGDIPKWVRNKKTGSRQGMPLVFGSDQHFGEVVFPERIEYLNGYDRQTAGMRLRRFFQNSIVIAKDFLRGLDYPGIVLALGGDLFSGDIHEELEKTNEGTIQQEMLHWIVPMISGIKLLADEFGKVFIPATVGNHPRSTRKPSHKMRVPNNFDWFFIELLRLFMADDKRVEFRNGASADVDFQVYSTRFNLSHGDQFRGGSGISGLLSPLMIGDARKRKRSQATHTEYDWLLLGHWHQRLSFKRIKVNGSLKGYDEYAYHNNFEFERPEQSFSIVDPERGITIDAPIFVDGTDEPWRKSIPAKIAPVELRRVA